MQFVASEIRDRVFAIDEIATLPPVFVRILEIVQDDSSTALDLAAEISLDQALAVKVLRTANSSYFGLRRQISSVSEAVVLLGFREVERLALTISVINLFSHSPGSARALRLLWRHSVACATAAGVLETAYRDRMTTLRGARIAGLIHDIGKAAIAQYLPEAHEEIVRLMHDDRLVSWEAERLVLDGVTHCDIGAWMTERWNLPSAIVAGVAAHHTPDAITDYPEMAHCIHLADWLCNGFGVQSSQLNIDFQPHPAAVETFGMDRDAIMDIQNDLDRQRGFMSAVAAGALS